MSDRLAELSGRITSVRKLGSVMGAMRGMAAARVRQAEGEVAAVDSYARTIQNALSQVLSFGAGTPGVTGLEPADILVVFLAEQGFAGVFSEHLLDRLADDPATQPGGADAPRLCLVGTRGASIAAERGMSPWVFRPMPTHGAAVPRFADELTQTVLAACLNPAIGAKVGGLEPGPNRATSAPRIDALFTRLQPGGAPTLELVRLFPALPVPGAAPISPPLLNLTRENLLQDLLAEALYAGLCRAALHAIAAENNARMLAMAAAQSQTERTLEGLVALERRVRQETITSEIIELAAGEAAFHSHTRRRPPDANPAAE